MTSTTFISCDRETVVAWRSPILSDGRPEWPFWRRGGTPVLFLLDRATSHPWLMIDAPPSPELGDYSLAPAPYLGALSTVLSDLLTEEGS